jgi:RNA polymerase sigma factor (sigma-70 family)
MTGTLTPNSTFPDTELVAQSRLGNRQAFGQIVRRYQGMVAGVIYSFCGDFHRSEDLAQDTFVSAWKSLSGMNEPAKLAPWLCQIARRKALDFLRASSREKIHLAQPSPLPPAPAPASPLGEALASEESELLWRILSELPQPYRETMVLYYRQGQSTADVAMAMETTEETVRQRLTRGRAMLREQVSQTVERNLVRSAPGPAFTLVVLAALPALMPGAAKAATLGAAAKGSVLGGGALSGASSLLGPLIGIWGSSMALRSAWQNSQSPRERRFIARMAVLLGIYLASPFVTLLLLPAISPQYALHGLRAAWFILALTVLATFTITLGRHRWNAIRQSEAPDGKLPEPAPCQQKKVPVAMIVAIVACSMGWMFNLAWKARDFSGLEILFVVAAVLIAGGMYCWRRADSICFRRFNLLYVPILGLVSLIVMKWRVYEWIRIVDHERQVHPFKGTTLLLMATLFACVELLVVAISGPTRKNMPK